MVRILAIQEPMVRTAAMAVRVVPVELAALVVGQLRTALTVMEVPADLVVTVAQVVMVPLETRRSRTVATAAPVVMGV